SRSFLPAGVLRPRNGPRMPRGIRQWKRRGTRHGKDRHRARKTLQSHGKEVRDMSVHRQDGLSFATLRAAEAVIETKSLTGAALKLGISQPAISMHLGRLERAIGTSLIKKVGNKIIVKEEISRLIRQMLDLERRLKTVGYEKNVSKAKIGICTYCAPLLVERAGALGKLKETL